MGGERSQLVLTSEPPGAAAVDEGAEIPRAHAEALLDVCAGRLILERSAVPIEGGAEVIIDRITHPRRMARYFFHVHDGEDRPDDEGVELPGPEEARAEAVSPPERRCET